MKSKSVFAVVTTAAFFAASAAEPDRVQIREAIPLHVLTLPAPTGWWGSEPRIPQVRDSPGVAVLDFGRMDGPLGKSSPPSAFSTRVEFLRGVSDVDGAKAHFKRIHGIDLARPRGEDDPPSWGRLEQRSYPYGRVLIVDLGKLGWVPGNRYYYFFFEGPVGPITLYMGPTWYMDYDLARVRLDRAMTR